jgi:hypothetical protein
VSEHEPRTWRWVDVDGVESIVDEWELFSSLSSGTLAPYTLVWREGWAEWLPACQVGELASILPKDKVEQAVEPKLDPQATEPPPAPVDKYHSYQAREAAAKLLGKASGKTAPPPGPISLPGAPGVPPPPGPISLPGAPGVPPPPQPARPAQPTLVDGSQLSVTATLRPPGAVPPPPRAVPLPAAPPADPVASLPAPVAPVIHVEGGADPVSEQPTHPRAALAPLPSWSDDLEAEVRAGGAAHPDAAPAWAPAPQAAPAKRGRPPLWIGLGAFALLGVAAVAGAAFLALRNRGEPGPALGSAVPSSSASAAPRAPLTACRLGKSAARLAPSVHPPVAPIASPLPNASKMAVGYASDARQAEGIVVDLDTLAVERPFHEKTDHDVGNVVPIMADGDLAFAVDLESGPLRAARTLDTKPRITVGWMSDGIGRKVGGDISLIWPSPADKPTDPRVAVMPDGFALTARRGGQSGRVVAGYIAPNGEKKSELVEVSSKAQLGTPAIATSGSNVLVAFAGRPTDESYWTLQLATSAGAEPPRVAQNFATPPGGLGADAISPAVEGLSNGRWLLQWTEGPAGRRQVRVQTLGFDLVPVGDPLTLSPDEANAGQGVVKVRGDTGLALFLVKKGKTHELWGALLKCRS